MLFDYVAPDFQSGSQLARVGAVWSQYPLQPLAPGVLSPFSASVLTELAGRAWYLYYDRLGFDPTPRARVVRRHKGRLYFNISLSAQMESEHAGLEPQTLRLNGVRHPLASWEKPGFLAAFKVGRVQKKIEEQLAESTRQMTAITEKARTWYLKTQGVQRWGQAEVLQIMEEIERVGVEGMVALLAARINLGYLYNRLVAELTEKGNTAKEGNAKESKVKSSTEALLLINNALCGLSGMAGAKMSEAKMIEVAILDTLPNLAGAFAEPATLAWLKAGDFGKWRTELPNQEALSRLNAFIDAYGHRAVHEGEIAHARWSEDAGLLLQAILASAEAPQAAKLPQASQQSATGSMQALLAALPATAAKQAEQTIQKIGELHKLQSKALHALAYILAGTRSWALAAAREAMVDKRLHSTDEVFLFELEEIKQMMTGEWNISSLAEIRETTAERQVEQEKLYQEIAPALLVGDAEAFAVHPGQPGVSGKATAALAMWKPTAPQACRDALLATTVLDSGFVLALPLAKGFVAEAGSPCDPFVLAAQGLQRPVVTALGIGYSKLHDGAPTTVDVNAETVTVSQE